MVKNKTSKDADNKLSTSKKLAVSFDPVQELQTPLAVAQQAVQQTLDLAKNGKVCVLAMGEDHCVLSHKVSEALALKEFVAKKQNVTLFMECPHNRLYTLLLDRGYDAVDASKLAEHIKALDTDGHITAKAIIGGNIPSLRGRNFGTFQSQIMLQAAINHDTKVVYADAARIYPEDFFWIDFSDPSTNKTALQLNARRGSDGEMGPDDLLIRNTHMAQTIKRELKKNGGVGLLSTGAAHCLGFEDVENGFHSYNASLARQFQKLGLPAVMLRMFGEEVLPSDYKSPTGKQIHMFNKPGPLTLVSDMSDPDISAFLTKHGLAPDRYDPRKFAERYKAEFDSILRQAEIDLGIKTPVLPKVTSSHIKYPKT